MSAPHHGLDGSPLEPEDQAAMRRFAEELKGTAEREYPQGRLSGDDEGVTAFYIAADGRTGLLHIQFTKPIKWLALDLPAAKRLRDVLSDKIEMLRYMRKT